MRKAATLQEDKGPQTPAWVVSFTDMVTLLLAFFVLLQAFAMEQDPTLFFQGQGAFRTEIAGFVLPEWIIGKARILEAENPKKRHPTEEADSEIEQVRVVDPKDEQIRKIFRDLKQVIETKTSDIKVKASNVISAPIRFEPSRASLDASAKEYLNGLAMNLEQNVEKDEVKIYVVGLAADAPPGKDRWILSARRAESVADFLRGSLARETSTRSWRVTSWGTGVSGAEHARPDATEQQKFIRITIMGAE